MSKFIFLIVFALLSVYVLNTEAVDSNEYMDYLENKLGLEFMDIGEDYKGDDENGDFMRVGFTLQFWVYWDYNQPGTDGGVVYGRAHPQSLRTDFNLTNGPVFTKTFFDSEPLILWESDTTDYLSNGYYAENGTISFENGLHTVHFRTNGYWGHQIGSYTGASEYEIYAGTGIFSNIQSGLMMDMFDSYPKQALEFRVNCWGSVIVPKSNIEMMANIVDVEAFKAQQKEEIYPLTSVKLSKEELMENTPELNENFGVEDDFPGFAHEPGTEPPFISYNGYKRVQFALQFDCFWNYTLGGTTNCLAKPQVISTFTNNEGSEVHWNKLIENTDVSLAKFTSETYYYYTNEIPGVYYENGTITFTGGHSVDFDSWNYWGHQINSWGGANVFYLTGGTGIFKNCGGVMMDMFDSWPRHAGAFFINVWVVAYVPPENFH